ncbi:hypothetical protein M0R45_001903 [Rubus argutus]|uniref:Plastocyanin-like domain-containing protein n=1 Tax=Rubus argutus TaxID=59490 RepID=A0AAW1VKW7_RUBAR
MGMFPCFMGPLLLSVALLCIVNGHVHFYDFVLREANFTRLGSTKSMLVVNDSFPGPTIRVQKGDTVYVNVQNQGDYGVTIHWHGVHQPRNPWSDGFPFPEPDGEDIIILGSWYTDDVNEVVAEALEDGSLTPVSDCYTINGQPGDFFAYSNGVSK